MARPPFPAQEGQSEPEHSHASRSQSLFGAPFQNLPSAHNFASSHFFWLQSNIGPKHSGKVLLIEHCTVSHTKATCVFE